MATGSGIAAQVGFKAESTYGTAVVVDRFLPFRSESIADTYERAIADDIVAGAQMQRSDQVRSGNKSISGTLGYYLFNRNQALLWLMALGANSTTGAGPYTHAVTPGELTGDALTLQVGRPDTGGTVRAFTYSGVKVAGLSLAVTAGEYATLDVDVVAQDVTTATALASASFPASLYRYHADDLGVTIGGTAVCVRNLQLDIVNALDDTRRCVGSNLIKEPTRNDHLSVSGSLEIEWTDLTHYARVQALTTAAVVFTFAKSPDSLTITLGTARFDNASQPVAGRGVVYQTLDFTAAGTSDANGLTVSVVNADSAA